MSPQAPPTIALRSISAFYEWLRGLRDLDQDVRIWTHFVFSRETSALSLGLSPHGATKVSRDESTLPVFRVNRSYGRDAQHRVSGWFVVVSAPQRGIYKLVSVSDRVFWREGVIRLLRASYPRVAPFYFMQRELRDGLQTLKANLPKNVRLNMVRASIKERIGMRSTVGARERRRYRTDVVYTEEDLSQAFQVTQDRQQWFKTVTVELDELTRSGFSRPMATLTLSKDGWAGWDTVENGYDQVLEEALLTDAAERLLLFRDRGLRTREYKPASPIALEFDSAVFEDVRVVRALSQALLKYPRAAKAVLHQNPYLHMSLSDEADGSSFQVWVLNPSRILLLPGLFASEPALNRVVNHLVENFRDARVGEYKPEDGEGSL